MILEWQSPTLRALHNRNASLSSLEPRRVQNKHVGRVFWVFHSWFVDRHISTHALHVLTSLCPNSHPYEHILITSHFKDPSSSSVTCKSIKWECKILEPQLRGRPVSVTFWPFWIHFCTSVIFYLMKFLPGHYCLWFIYHPLWYCLLFT